jgi:DNA-binding IclR family transcriptional regulator
MIAKSTAAKKARKKKAKDASGGVRTVRVTVRVLDALAEFQEPARITDLAKRLKMTLPRVSRHVSTLRSLGIVEKAEPLEAYRLGAKLFTLGQAALKQSTLANVAYPHLLKLRDQLRQCVLLAVASPGGATVLMCLDSGQDTAIVVKPGSLLVFPQSPTARLLFSFSAQSARGLAASNLATTLMGLPEVNRKQLEAKMLQVVEDYYDFSPDVRSTGFGSVACPIFNVEDHVIGAVTVVIPTQSLGTQLDAQLVNCIKACARRISSSLGSKTWDTRRE